MKKKWRYILTGLALVGGLLQTVPAQEPPPPRPKEKSRPRHRQPPAVHLTPEQEQEAIAYIREVDPGQAERLVRLKAKDPARYMEALNRGLNEKRRLQRWKQEDPARYEQEVEIRDLERQSHELAEAYRKGANEKERGEIRPKLSALTARLIDLREDRRREDVKRMERDLERLRRILTERQKNREQIIQRRIAQLLGEAEAMEW